MKDGIKIKGNVRVRVFDADGELKRRNPGFFRRLFGLRGKPVVQEFHNIVTRQGDALIADSLLAAPARKKVSDASGFIQVGSGWKNGTHKHAARCAAPAGNMRALDGGYPVLAASWGDTGDTTVVYRATFAAGTLDADGINEACLLNGNGSAADCLAYARIAPAVNVAASDTLQIVWEITIVGQ